LILTAYFHLALRSRMSGSVPTYTPLMPSWREQENFSWIKIDQLDVTCFIISLFTAQHVSNVSTSIFRSLRLICWFISCVLLLWFDVCWCYGVVRLGWCGIVMQAEARCASACITIHNKSQAPEDGCINVWNMLSNKQCNNKASDIKLVYLYWTIKMMKGPINIRSLSIYMNSLTFNSKKGSSTFCTEVVHCVMYSEFQLTVTIEV
jgi:hypothetical protein